MNNKENETGKIPKSEDQTDDQTHAQDKAGDLETDLEIDKLQVLKTPWAEGEVLDGTPDSQDPVALLVEESAKMKDRLMRTLADMENLRQRTAREVKDARAYAVSNFARDMLNAGDNMRRALEAVPEEARTAADTDLKALLEGVELTEREMLKAFESHGVRKITPLNERFDPNFHQAMFEVQNPDVANSTIIDVVQDGYVIGDRVLRPAMVGVAKGGPKLAKVTSEEDLALEPADFENPIPHTALSEAPEESPQEMPDASPSENSGSVGSRVDKSA